MTRKFTLLLCLHISLLASLMIGSTANADTAIAPHATRATRAAGAIHAKHAPTLPESIYALKGIDPRQEDDTDLAPLDNIIGDAHVVALGEAMHTSGGFHDVRFRVVRHLIRDKGFRVLTLETPRLWSQPLVNFVDDCRHAESVDATRLDRAMRTMFPVFASETMRDMVGWICQYNIAHPTDAVSFTGFDVQEPEALAREIDDMLSTHEDVPEMLGLQPDIVRCAGMKHDGKVSLDQELSCRTIIDNELQLLGGEKAEEDGVTEDELALLRLNLRSLRANIENFYYAGPGHAPEAVQYQTRDKAMADIFLTLQALRWKNTRTIIWAHNRHIERDGMGESAGEVAKNSATKAPFKNMGQFLSESLGDDYKAIGLLAFQLEINWPAIHAVCAVAGQARSMKPAELKLRLLDRPALIVDTAAMRNKPGAFFPDNIAYSYSQDSEGPITKEFDGLIYLQNSQAMTPIKEMPCPTEPNWPKPKLPGKILATLNDTH